MMLAISLILSVACGEHGHAEVGKLPVVEPAGAGDTNFARACEHPLHWWVQSDSPVLASLNTFDFEPDIGLLVTDPIEHSLFLFDTTASYVQEMGRAGGGPGEFRDLRDAIFMGDDRIVAVDRVAGLTEFTLNGTVVFTAGGGKLIGGGMLARLSDSEVAIAVTSPGIPNADVGAFLVWTYDLREHRVVRQFAREDAARARRLMLLRDVHLSVGNRGSIIAITVPYKPSVQLVSTNGTLLHRSVGALDGFRVAAALRRPLHTTREMLDWALSSSHTLGAAVPSESRGWIAWDDIRDYLVHYYVTAVQFSPPALGPTFEIPMRFIRAYGDTLLFVDERRAPKYGLYVCRGWDESSE